jgi:hypothetical protein
MPRTLSRTARRGLNESDTTRNPRLRFGSRAQLPVARLLGPHRRSALAGRFITLTQTQQTPPPRPRTTPSRRSWFRRGCERVRDEARHAWCGRAARVSRRRRRAPASVAKRQRRELTTRACCRVIGAVPVARGARSGRRCREDEDGKSSGHVLSAVGSRTLRSAPLGLGGASPGPSFS